MQSTKEEFEDVDPLFMQNLDDESLQNLAITENLIKQLSA